MRHVLASIARTATLAILDDAVDRASNAKHYLEQQAAGEAHEALFRMPARRSARKHFGTLACIFRDLGLVAWRGG